MPRGKDCKGTNEILYYVMPCKMTLFMAAVSILNLLNMDWLPTKVVNEDTKRAAGILDPKSEGLLYSIIDRPGSQSIPSIPPYLCESLHALRTAAAFVTTTRTIQWKSHGTAWYQFKKNRRKFLIVLLWHAGEV